MAISMRGLSPLISTPGEQVLLTTSHPPLTLAPVPLPQLATFLPDLQSWRNEKFSLKYLERTYDFGSLETFINRSTSREA